MIDARLTLTQILLLILYAAGMAGGQLLFKLAALRLPTALILYAALAVLWVWILTFTPLSRAYPFVALAFALTPIAAAYAFAEPMTARLAAGIAAIMVGLFLVAG